MGIKKIICTVCVFAALALAIAGYFVLPETVVVQVGLSGQPTSTMPKLFAVIAPLLISIAGAVVSFLKPNEENRALILSVLGVIVYGLMFIFN